MRCFIIAALTADGYIGRHAAELAVTSKEDKQLFVRLTKEAGVAIFGYNTYATFNRALPGRRTIVYTHDPSKVTEPGVEATDEAPEVLLQRLESEGATAVAICGGAQINTLFMDAGLVTELYLTTVPEVFGQGVGLFSKPYDARLTIIKQEKLSADTFLTHYRVERTDAAL